MRSQASPSFVLAICATLAGAAFACGSDRAGNSPARALRDSGPPGKGNGDAGPPKSDGTGGSTNPEGAGGAGLSTGGDTGTGAASPGDAGSGSGGTSSSADAGSGGARFSTPDAGSGGQSSGNGGRDPGAEAGPPTGHIPLFVAYGHGGRTLVSCDDGRTWIGEHVFAEEGGDHGPYSALARMTYGLGRFVAAAGWGAPSKLLVSEDGFQWEELGPDAYTDDDGNSVELRFGATGVVFDGTVFFALLSGGTWRSDDGLRWKQLPDTFPPLPTDAEFRRIGGGDGRILVPTAGRLLISDDAGDTWFEGTGYAAACNGRIQRGGNLRVVGSRIVVGGRDGTVCASSDGGNAFRSVALTSWFSDFVWRADEFVTIARPSAGAGGARTVFRSIDGHDWTEAPGTLNGTPALLAVSDTGTLVSINGAGTAFFRSTDGGQTWEPATSEGTRSYGLTSVVFGYGAASARCPAQ